MSVIEEEFKTYIQKKESITYNKENKKFDIKEHYYFYELELYSRAISNDAKHDFSKLLLELIKKEGLELLTWSKKAIELQNKIGRAHV